MLMKLTPSVHDTLGIKSIRFYLKIRTRKTQVRHELKHTLDQIVPSFKYDVIAVINQAVPL